MKDSTKIWKVNRPASTVKKYDHSVKQADRVIPAPRMFKRIANAGLLADLLPIIPPGADLSPASNLKADQVGKIPGAVHEDGGWIGFRGWPTHQTTEADLALWSRWPGVGVGLSCRTVRGLDVDVTDAALSEWIEGKALDLLGAAPARIGRWPKVLLPYLGGPDRKMRVAFTKGEPGKPGHEAHGVEWLANGQFFVVAGKHPKEGVGSYEWRGGALAVNHSDFPTGDHGIEQVGDILARVTVEQVTALFDAVAAHVIGLGFTVHNKRAGAGCIYSVRTASADFIADLPRHIARAADYLKRAEPAIEDAGGEPDTFVIAQKCMDLGCTPAMTCGLMLEHWAGRCTPPWQEAELRVKVESAHHSRQNEVGCDALADPAEVFAPYLNQEQSQQGNTGDETPGTNKQDQEDWSRFFPVGLGDPDHVVNIEPADIDDYLLGSEVPPLQVVVDDWIEHGLYVALSGAGGTHKSRLLLQLVLALLYRRPWFPRGQGAIGNVQIDHVEYLSYENPKDETKRRVKAMSAKLLLKQEQRKATMKIWELRDTRQPLLIVPEQGNVTVTRFGKRMLLRWEKLAQAGKPTIAIVLDSLFNAIEFQGNTRNADDRAKYVIYALDHWARMFNAVILAPHHPSRGGMARGDTGYAPSFDNVPRVVLAIHEATKPDKSAPGGRVGTGKYHLRLAKANNMQQGRRLDLVYEEGVLNVESGAGSAIAGIHAAAKIALDAAYGEEDATRLAEAADAERQAIRLRHLGRDKVQRKGMYKGKRLTKEHWLIRTFCQMRGGTMQGGELPVATTKDADDFKDALESAVRFGLLAYWNCPAGSRPDRVGKAGYCMPPHAELPDDPWRDSAPDGADNNAESETPS